MDKFLLFGFINYMVSNNFLVGFVSGIFIGVNYHNRLEPYTNHIQYEAQKKFIEYKNIYEKNMKKNEHETEDNNEKRKWW